MGAQVREGISWGSPAGSLVAVPSLWDGEGCVSPFL